MNPQLLSYLCDPNDRQPLELHTFAGGSKPNGPTHSGSIVREGALVQPDSGRWYPIRDGIPSLFVDALRVGSESQSDRAFAARHHDALQQTGARLPADQQADQSTLMPLSGAETDSSDPDFVRIDSERRARDEQAEDYDRMLSLRLLERIETPAYRRALEVAVADSKSSTAVALSPLLEAGCGTGRFTALFAGMAREVVAVDMSRDSIARNRVRHAGRTLAPVHYIHADLTHLPLRDEMFGSVAHAGVYEHIPSRELRMQFLDHARRVLRSDGVLLLSAYRYAGLTKIFEKEGEHAGGIPFVRFTEDELRAEVETSFTIDYFRANLGIYMSMLTGRPIPIHQPAALTA